MISGKRPRFSGEQALNTRPEPVVRYGPYPELTVTAILVGYSPGAIITVSERYINRVWTASTDGYVDEVMSYLDKAERQFHEAREAFVARRG